MELKEMDFETRYEFEKFLAKNHICYCGLSGRKCENGIKCNLCQKSWVQDLWQKEQN